MWENGYCPENGLQPETLVFYHEPACGWRFELVAEVGVSMRFFPNSAALQFISDPWPCAGDDITLNVETVG